MSHQVRSITQLATTYGICQKPGGNGRRPFHPGFCMPGNRRVKHPRSMSRPRHQEAARHRLPADNHGTRRPLRTTGPTAAVRAIALPH